MWDAPLSKPPKKLPLQFPETKEREEQLQSKWATTWWSQYEPNASAARRTERLQWPLKTSPSASRRSSKGWVSRSDPSMGPRAVWPEAIKDAIETSQMRDKWGRKEQPAQRCSRVSRSIPIQSSRHWSRNAILWLLSRNSWHHHLIYTTDRGNPLTWSNFCKIWHLTRITKSQMSPFKFFKEQ